MTTDTSEKGLEALIVADMTGRLRLAAGCDGFAEEPEPFVGLHNWLLGDPKAYDRAWTVDLAQLRAFIAATQPPCWRRSISTTTARPARSSWPGCKARSASAASSMCCARASSTARTMSTCSTARRRRATPRPPSASRQNRFTVTRQLRYSRDETAAALDLGLFINGLPIATFELKNSLTKQTVEDAVEQYKRDRDPRERLFEFGRCVVHFAVDDSEVRLCTAAEGQGLVVPAVQQGLQRRRGQPAQPRRPQDRLSLEADPHAARA